MSTITTRSGKGSPLTNTEVDSNFTNLNTDKIEADSTDTLTNKIIDAMSNTVGADHLHYKVKATAALSKGVVVKITGYNSGEDAYEVAAVSSSSDVAVGIVDSSLSNGDFGLITNTGLFEGLDTSSFSVGDILYPNSSGGFTSTKPTTGTYQAAAFVLRAHATNGAVMTEFTEPHDANLAAFSDAITLPTSDGTSGQALITDGAGNISFGDVDALPSQTGNSGKYLTTDGTDPSWATVDLSSKLDLSGGTMTGAITFAAGQTFDGRDVSADGSKLDGIEAGATADQSASEIKTAYESNTNTNAYTDAEKTKLSGIEAGATADQTASEILTAIKTVDGAASGLDADLLDGQQGSYYASTSYVDSAVAGVVDSAPAALDTLNELAAALGDDANFATTVSTSIGEKLAKASNLSDLTSASTARTNLGLGSLATKSAVGAAEITDNTVGAAELNVTGNGTTSQYLRSDGDGSFSWVTPPDTDTTYSVGDGGLTEKNFTSALKTKLDGIESGATADQTASEILTAIKTVDGSGSGLDADNLDGRTWSSTRNAANTLVTRDGNGYTQLGWINTTSGATTTTIDKIYASYDSYVRYVTPATLISQLGLWTSGNDGSGSGLDADTVDGIHASSFLQGNQTITLSGDASGSGTTSIAVTVADDSHNHSSSSGNFTVGGDLTVSGGQITNVNSATRDKYRVWSSGTYAIGMDATYTFGALSDYAMTFQMSNTAGRGFWWGDSSHTNAQGAMSLTTDGHLSVANTVKIGYGESNTSGAAYDLDVSGNGHITGSLHVGSYIYHDGDTNSYLRFVAADDVQLVAGGRQMLRMDEGTDPDKLRFVTDNDWTNSSGNWNMSGTVTAAAFVGDGTGLTGISATTASGCIYENAQTISSNYTMTTNYNGHSVGDITISSGVTVTIPTGSNWVVS